MPAENQDPDANEQIRHDGEDGGPAALTGAAEQPAQRATDFAGGAQQEEGCERSGEGRECNACEN